MPIVYTLPPPTGNTWYLAYGSNMSTEKFVKQRGIKPLRTVAVEVPLWTLTMDSAGVPYSEPSYGSISPLKHEKDGQGLMGVAYLLSPENYAKALASEGGGIAYAEVEVRACMTSPTTDEHLLSLDTSVGVRTLVTVMRHKARPSTRYMGLLRTGADEAELPPSYQDFLASIPVYLPPREIIPKIGATVFLIFWLPVMSVAERVTRRSLRHSKTGNAPTWVIALVRGIVFTMWLYHDYVHGPLWGRGDGMVGFTI
ncbi:hypothetical protein F5Y17DRAFT_445249 [Xylariaceae sp. FL0594]|nr:hypothetical protein F5Y17DRAFT_445249 [Xylariaceae sp. FL0594]